MALMQLHAIQTTDLTLQKVLEGASNYGVNDDMAYHK